MPHDPGCIVLVETVAGRRQQVADASPAAIAKGITPGMTVAEARMLHPGIVCIPHDPAADRRALHALARWMTRFTPDVAVGWPITDEDDDDQPAALFLDITGCERLFGGVENIADQVRSALSRFGVPAEIAIAPTPGAAWAIAAFSPSPSKAGSALLTQANRGRRPASPRRHEEHEGHEEESSNNPAQSRRNKKREEPQRRRDTQKALKSNGPLCLCGSVASLDSGRTDQQVQFASSSCPSCSSYLRGKAEDQTARLIAFHHLEAALLPLPLESLRLGPDLIRALRHLGLRTIGQVLDLPRDELPARFGPLLRKRLDQALGDAPEPLIWIGFDQPVAASMELDSPIDAQESIWLVVERLLDRVLVDLTRRAAGIRLMELSLSPDRATKRPPTLRSIPLSRPTRNRAILIDLLRRATENLQGDGFCTFRLNVPRHERLTEEQVVFFGDAGTASQVALENLFERLRVSFGPQIVLTPIPIESYLPERAWQASAEAGNARARDSPNRARDASVHSPGDVAPVRPLYLMPTPAEIGVICEPSDEQLGKPRQFTWQGRVHRLSHAVGPERIAGEWWRGHHRTRDYYDVQDEQGLRFWIFRVTRILGERYTTRWFMQGRFG